MKFVCSDGVTFLIHCLAFLDIFDVILSADVLILVFFLDIFLDLFAEVSEGNYQHNL